MSAHDDLRCLAGASVLAVALLVTSCRDNKANPSRPVSPQQPVAASGGPVSVSSEALASAAPNESNVSRFPSTAAAASAPIPQQWFDADKAVVRLQPDAFPQLPLPVRAELKARGCTIPQTYADHTPHNAVAGHIMRRTSTDWAVLCSVLRVSKVLIFPNGQTGSVIEWEPSDDLQWLQGIGGGVIGYSRAISVVTPRSMRTYAKAELPGPLDHDGIDEAFIEKASTIHYWIRGQWLVIPGMD